MEQIKKFLRSKGFALALIACLVAAAAAGVWAVRTVREELKKSLDELTLPGTEEQQALPGIDETLDGMWNETEENTWQQPDTNVANSVADVPLPAASALQDGAASSSGRQSGSGLVSEPSALRTDSAPASSLQTAAYRQPVDGQILNVCSGDELVYNKTLGDWRTHNGVDYACAQGAEVCAPAEGRVTALETGSSWGGVVCIQDAEGRQWRLCGVSDVQVKEGETVTAGQQLGKAGSISCECAEPSHIHLELLQNGAYLDPAKLIR